MKPLRKVLVANRGEIARRIFRACRALGLETVAIYADPDREAPFVREADEAVYIGSPVTGGSFLAFDVILDAAVRTGADAIHPGYGFLAENADFAEACERRGLCFVGPPASAIRAMGAKIEAKLIAQRAGVPIIPGFSAAGLNDDEILRKARELHFPLLVKASAGGGGKGMRRVDSPTALPEALAAARREAQAAFGDDTLLIERYIENPRHIEIQVFGDHHGNIVHLFERECSIQRRYQKIIEEAPSPFVNDVLRERMGAAAVALARSLGYFSAGTVEFVVDGEVRRSGRKALGIAVPAGGKADFSLEETLTYVKDEDDLKAMDARGGSLLTALRGTLVVTAAGPKTYELPFARSKDVRTPRLPHLKLHEFEAGRFAQDEVQAVFHLGVENPNPFTLSISGITYVVTVAGKEVARGTIGAGEKISPSSTGVFDVTVTVNQDTHGKDVVKLIKGLELPFTVSGTLRAPMYVEPLTAEGRIKLTPPR